MPNLNYRGLRALFLFILILPLISLANQSVAIKEITAKELWESDEWKRLLHVQTSILLYQRSEADSDSFFLHENGKYDFKAELLALAKGVFDQKNINDSHPICRFPARTIWLHRKLNITFDEKIFRQCHKYQKFLKLVKAENVSLVFSSYYLESPASAFGHTLLRLGRPKTKHYQNTELLDMGINSAAQVTTSNALLYALMGMIGAFDGYYSTVPYFYKVREYNDFESRDLWSYDLNLTPQQIKRMNNHLWEVGNASFNYYYFSENCSYNLFTLLEVANFKLDLVSKLPLIYTIPSHTIQIIHDIPGLVKNVRPIPSLRKKFDYYFNQLTSEQRKLLIKAFEEQNHNLIMNSEYGEDKKTDLLDTLIYYVDYKHPHDVLLQEGEISKWKNKILISRSKMDSKGYVDPPPVSKNEAPHLGHRPRRLNLSVSHVDNEMQYHLGYRFALHSFMDPVIGQPALATLEFGDFSLFYRDNKIKIEKLDIFEVMTLNPWTQYHKPFSFKVRLGLSNEQILCDNCTPFSLDVGGGLTFFHNGKSTLYSFLNTEIILEDDFEDDFTLKISPEIGFKRIWCDSFASNITVRHDFPINSTDGYWNGALSNYYYFQTTASIYVNFTYFEDHDISTKLGLSYYF